ncbi:MAG: hypothetical protein J07HB67_02814 [halophilic archaeon J07HB67]|nr:MAG: hypothetical protein J07HB67_02814 [halophilic archaeon J07HB67]
MYVSTKPAIPSSSLGYTTSATATSVSRADPSSVGSSPSAPDRSVSSVSPSTTRSATTPPPTATPAADNAASASRLVSFTRLV